MRRISSALEVCALLLMLVLAVSCGQADSTSISNDVESESVEAVTSALSESSAPDVVEASPSSDLPDYEVINTEKTDTPLKAQVVIQAVVSGNVTEESLENLLYNLYYAARLDKGFLQYHDRVTNVYIYLFGSREHAVSGYQWLAMLDKSYNDGVPDTKISDSRLALFLDPPVAEERFGLSEAVRMEVFREIVRAEDRAIEESMERFPDLLPGDPGYSQAAFMRQLEKQMDEQDRLTDLYKDELAAEYGITRDELSEIGREGMNKEWPMPAYGS